jgi:hypothetical protein
VKHRVGIVSNPKSRANRGGIDAFFRRAEKLGVHATPRTEHELAEVLQHFAREGVDLLVVNGGDGTLREVLTALPGAYGDSPPEIALLSAGKINLAARNVGSPGHGPAALELLLSAAEEGRLRRSERPVLEVSWPGEPERGKVRGFLFGAGAFAEGNRMAEAHVHRSGIHGAAAVAVTTALMLLNTHAMRAGVKMRVSPDGGALRGEQQFLMLATTLDRLVLRLWPFWGEGDSPIRWFAAPAHPKRLLAALYAVARRRAGGWMEDAGYRSGRAGQIHLALDAPFVIDGERFWPGRQGILLSAPDRITFVAP